VAAIDHGSRAHALLSASGAGRWINCTPSARLEEKFQQSKQSIFAEEGTLAHEFGDINIRRLVNFIDAKVHGVEIKKLRKHKLYSLEMEPEVEKYTTYVLETFNAIKQTCPDAILLIEERLDFSHLVEGGFGTGDICIIADGKLYVIDLKYGRGVKVYAKENSQLMLYGCGALRKYEMMYDIQTVVLVIVQPRLDHIDGWEIYADDLISWGENIARPKALLAYSGEGEQIPGEHCKFCKVKGMCKALANQQLELAKYDFKDPYLLEKSEIISIFESTPMLIDWAQSVAAYILDSALKGEEWPGYKLVAGKANRKWTDEDKVVNLLLDEGYSQLQFLNTKLKGIGEIEKLIGKANFPEVVGDLVAKPQGAPTLVKEEDPRPALNGLQAAINEFS